MNDDIDVVITWVDGSDKQWIAEKIRYSGKDPSPNEVDINTSRYRDWDNLQYLLRGIERFMPWARKVHLVTNGQKPKWLNVGYEKLNWVKHEEFIPAEYLPTFSSHPIELNLHRIKGLSERFIYFNDDTFVINYTSRHVFFKKGLPCNQASLWRVASSDYHDIMPHIMLNTASVINQNFQLTSVLKRHWNKWLSPRNSVANVLLTISLLPSAKGKFPALYYHHLPHAMLKSTFAEIWEKEEKIMQMTCRNRFRSIHDVSITQLAMDWQEASGQFVPINIRKKGEVIYCAPTNISKAKKTILSQKKEFVCINDAEAIDFEKSKKMINACFQQILPNKSGFEL